MKKNKYSLIGVMSGTSLDGVDLAYVCFEENRKWSFEILKAETFPYDTVWEKKLKDAVGYSENELKELDISYTHLLADIINTFVSKNNLNEIDAVCSHGHTILHQPQNKITFQIGNLPILSNLIAQNVICDFRVQDVALGGQGAPLVPIGDELLFSMHTYCVNLGGFSNISIRQSNERIAYDICPVNIVLNHYIQKTGVSFDDKGRLASTGKINVLLLKELNSLHYYNQPPPKSLGFEWVKLIVFPLIDSYQLTVNDVLRTFVEHVAIQISKSLSAKNSSALFTGGGVYNLFLMERIIALSNSNIILPDNDLIEYKEALIFAFLGLLKVRNETNVLASVTGAAKNHSSGKVFYFN